MNNVDIKAKAESKLATVTMDVLKQLWLVTETQTITAEVATVRGWIMGEFERRNPVGFERWIDTNDLAAM